MAIQSDYINSLLGYGTWHDVLTPEQKNERNRLAFQVLVQLAYEEGVYDKIKQGVLDAKAMEEMNKRIEAQQKRETS